jgi:ribulose-5-phosphate 4-epimerase/fuculose-1-phosphate aldolase
MTNDLDQADDLTRETVLANRILGNESILDAYGHVSMRCPDRPDRFVMSVAKAPELVVPADLVELAVDTGEPDVAPAAHLYIERYIHAAIYAARPDVMTVCHNHAMSIIPFSIVPDVPLRAVAHIGRFLGTGVPIWDIADDFGPNSKLLVSSMDHGRSLATTLGDANVALLRGHGSVVTGRTASQLVERCVHMDRNARIQLAAHQLGGGSYIPLHDGECEAPLVPPPPVTDNRAWHYYVRRATGGASSSNGGNA